MTLDNRMKEMIALGAAVGANCHPCLNYHYTKARELGLDAEAIAAALEVGRMVRKGAASNLDKLAEEVLAKAKSEERADSAACGCAPEAACG